MIQNMEPERAFYDHKTGSILQGLRISLFTLTSHLHLLHEMANTPDVKSILEGEGAKWHNEIKETVIEKEKESVKLMRSLSDKINRIDNEKKVIVVY